MTQFGEANMLGYASLIGFTTSIGCDKIVNAYK